MMVIGNLTMQVTMDTAKFEVEMKECLNRFIRDNSLPLEVRESFREELRDVLSRCIEVNRMDERPKQPTHKCIDCNQLMYVRSPHIQDGLSCDVCGGSVTPFGSLRSIMHTPRA